MQEIEDSEGVKECKQMQNYLREHGVPISLETLTRSVSIFLLQLFFICISACFLCTEVPSSLAILPWFLKQFCGETDDFVIEVLWSSFLYECCVVVAEVFCRPLSISRRGCDL